MTPRYARYLAKSYLYLLALLTLSRAISAVMVWENLQQESWGSLAQAFFLGWRFDNVIICATLAIPFLLLTLNHFVFKSQRLQRISSWPLYVFLTIIILLQMIDLAYFDHFNVRSTVILFNWLDDITFVVKMAKDEPLWFFGGLAIPFVMWLFLWPLRRWNKQSFWHPLVGKSFPSWIGASVLIIGLLFLGIRGRAAIKSPIREGTAYFSQNPTLNNLALNPCFTFFSSWIRAKKYKEKPLRFMSIEKARTLVQAARPIHQGSLKDWNVVLVIMEGMSAHYTTLQKNPSWTPVLDRLMSEGLSFQQAYSAGLHTFNGVWSTLFSYPSPYTTHPLKRDVIPVLNSFATQMHKKNIHTLFFTTHDDQFDNMAGFVRQNGFKQIIHQGDYPPERVMSILGVPDHDMFHYALPVLAQADKGSRFFAAMLTGSNHKPHIIPPELKAKFNSPDEKENIVRYSDWALGDFLERARLEPWGQRTIFAFIADHGQAVGTDRLDQILSYHHVPFIVWGPGLIKPQTVTTPVMQVDVMPTLMGLVGGEWLNTTLGENALQKPRDWIYVGRDVTTCLMIATELHCETQDRDHSIMKFPKPFWAESSETSKVNKWDIIHAELQMSDSVLRDRKLIP
jgi:phosphoglycerol transferase MdoB-like AlkP superfamily enzyme